MSAIDVSLKEVGKEYRLGTARNASTFWALRNVSFEVARGSSIGVIGRNGAGKTTLFKLLAGITAPTQGRIVMDGRVAALIEVGSGFHPELTGRENIFLSGSLLGMRRREIAAKIDRIVDFAGVQRFIDTPVKWYSSGMYVRLGFSVAAHLEPHILLVDEVLAVGDAEFQGRCLERIQELRRQGTTNLFISHDLTAIERLCDRAVLLDKGELVLSGVPRDVVAAYHRQLSADGGFDGDLPPESRNSGVVITNVAMHSPGASEALSFATGKTLVVSLHYEAATPLADVEFELRYYAADGRTLIAATRTGERGEALTVRPPGGVVEFTCPSLPLTEGAYCIGAVVRELASAKSLAWWDRETMLYVRGGPRTDGQFHAAHDWRMIPVDKSEAIQSMNLIA